MLKKNLAEVASLLLAALIQNIFARVHDTGLKRLFVKLDEYLTDSLTCQRLVQLCPSHGLLSCKLCHYLNQWCV